AELSDVAGDVLTEGAHTERVLVGRAHLVRAEATRDDARGARGEARTVAVVGDGRGDAGLADRGEGTGVDDVPEERPFLHRIVDPIDAPADGGVVGVEPDGDVNAGRVDVRHQAGRDALDALGVAVAPAVLP